MHSRDYRGRRRRGRGRYLIGRLARKDFEKNAFDARHQHAGARDPYRGPRGKFSVIDDGLHQLAHYNLRSQPLFSLLSRRTASHKLNAFNNLSNDLSLRHSTAAVADLARAVAGSNPFALKTAAASAAGK